MLVQALDLSASRLKGCPSHHKGQPNKTHQAEVKAVFEDLLGRPQDHAGTYAPDCQVHTRRVVLANAARARSSCRWLEANIR